ncbi:MAG: flagellar basal body-associated FliL family protein [Mesorhizobium sp.]|nr:flagellar basal body-associated FliL family protein [Mesorhizobium sp.]
MAATDATADKPKGPSLVIQLAVLAVLTAGAIGAGWVSATMIGDRQSPPASEVTPDRATEIRTSEMSNGVGIVHIDPITTNLGSPADMWIRLELSLVFTGEPDLAMAELIHQDLLAYLRTIKVHQIQGASGFQHLKGDLSERAQIRSDGVVREVLVRTMLVE